jgi:hypothetical protein
MNYADTKFEPLKERTMLIPNLSLQKDKMCWYQIWAFEGMNYSDTKFEIAKG